MPYANVNQQAMLHIFVHLFFFLRGTPAIFIYLQAKQHHNIIRLIDNSLIRTVVIKSQIRI